MTRNITCGQTEPGTAVRPERVICSPFALSFQPQSGCPETMNLVFASAAKQSSFKRRDCFSAFAKTNLRLFVDELMESLSKGLSTDTQHNFIWELFSRHRLSCANYYWRLSYGLRAANAIDPSSRPANGKSGQYLFTQSYTCVRPASRAFGPWKQLDD